MTEVDLPNSVIYLGTGAFFNCVALKKVTEHASVLAFGEAAFSVWYEGDEFYSPLPELTVYTSEGTLMHQYAEAYDIPVVLSAHVPSVATRVFSSVPFCHLYNPDSFRGWKFTSAYCNLSRTVSSIAVAVIRSFAISSMP